MPRPLLLAATAAVLAACTARSDADRAETAVAADGAAEGAAAASPNASAPAAAAPAAASEAPVTAEDLDRYQRGLEGEIAGYRAAAENVAKARTAADTATAMLAALPRTMADSGAARAGVDYPRYSYLESTIGTVISRSIMNPALAKMGDTSALADLPAEAQARARANMAEMAALNSDSAIYAGVPEAVRPALKERVGGRLGELWRERMKAQTEAALGKR